VTVTMRAPLVLISLRVKPGSIFKSRNTPNISS
jgi:hypothetical protein